jgi:hypothetical protein
MIPSFKIIPGALFPVLPAGIHEATIAEVELRYTGTPRRKDLFNGLVNGLNNLFGSGCTQAFLDGSFITAKPKPNDYEVCWDPRFVDPNLLDPVFLDFSFGTAFQKLKYLGEYFPSIATETGSGKSFLDFFQTDKETGKQKGIIKIKNYLPGGSTI